MKIVDIDQFTVLAYEFVEEGMLYTEQHKAAWQLFQDVLLDCYDIHLEEKEVLEGEKGKPYFADHCVEFNITHTKGLVACVICGNSQVGVDAEKIRDGVEKAAKKVMTENEMKHYNLLACAAQREYFFKIWALKEALGKAYGCGINNDFAKPEFILADTIACTDYRFWYYQWSISNEKNEYIISVAVEK